MMIELYRFHGLQFLVSLISLVTLFRLVGSSHGLKCYGGMTVYGQQIPGNKITLEDCNNDRICLTLDYKILWFIPMKLAFCYSKDFDVNTICSEIKGAQDCQVSSSRVLLNYKRITLSRLHIEYTLFTLRLQL